MSTFMQKKENVVRKCYIVDAANRPLGETAVIVANLLRGKNEPEFTPNVDCGHFVFVINADKIVLTGKKLEQKYYYRNSGYIGGMKAVQYKTLMQTRPEKAMELAVKGMLPHNKLGDRVFTRLKVFASEAAAEKALNKYAGLKPVAYEA